MRTLSFFALFQVFYSLQIAHAVVKWDQVNFIRSRLQDSKRKAPQPTLGRKLPLLPMKYQADFYLYATEKDNPSPWYHLPPPPYEVGRGSVYYDHTIPAIVEKYDDFCLSVFGDLGYHWQCTFHHVKETSYLLSNDKRFPYGPGKCCIWRQPWKVPDRDFEKAMKYDRTDFYNGILTEWYTFGPPSALFSYGFTWNVKTGTLNRIPVAFTYPFDIGWGAQNFFNIKEEITDPTVFDIPPSCHNTSYCISPPGF